MIRHFSSALVLILVSVMLGACAAPNMMHSDPGTPVAGPEPGKAMVVFMNDYAFNRTERSFINDGGNYIGISEPDSKFAYLAGPGERLLMVASKNAGFMGAANQIET